MRLRALLLTTHDDGRILKVSHAVRVLLKSLLYPYSA